VTRPDLTSLTLEQKASLLSGRDFWTTKPLDAAGVPSLVLTDGPHGIRLQAGVSDHLGLNESVPATCFPPAVAVGSSWNPEVAGKLGAAVGREGRALGVHVILGPGVNIKRSPLGGRNFEYYSEDPLLSGVLASAHVRAMQAEGPGASVKHFAANNQETNRMQVSAEVDERTLREIYLPAFEHVVKEARPATVMSAYNRLNGVPASEHHWLLTDVLRSEWGFEGLVVSDWGGVTNRVAALAAGLDLEMPGHDGSSDAAIVAAVRNGELSEQVVNDSVDRVAALTRHVVPQGSAVDLNAHRLLAQELATECAVLLKNEQQTLPLLPASRVAVVGAFAILPRFQGGGSSHIHPTFVDTPLEAMTALAVQGGSSITFAEGFSLDEPDREDVLRDEALAVARAADVTVIFAGLSEREESEGFDRETLDLPPAQVSLIRAVAAVSSRTIVVLSNGGMVSLEAWHDDVEAILEGWLLGQGGGRALADLLFGVQNPSGHLAESLPLRLQDNPSFLNFPGEQGQVRYGEGVMVGYRHYETVDRPVRYPFGHGLSYTTFDTHDVQATATGDDSAVVSLTVTNSGSRAGKHVVQVYVATSAGPVRRPARELRAFQKIALEPGESRTLTLDLNRRAFAYYDVPLGRWVVAPGEYHVQIGANAHDVLTETTLTLAGDTIIPLLTLDSTLDEWLNHPVAGPRFTGALLAGIPEEQRQQVSQNADELFRLAASMRLRNVAMFLNLPEAALTPLLALTEA